MLTTFFFFFKRNKTPHGVQILNKIFPLYFLPYHKKILLSIDSWKIFKKYFLFCFCLKIGHFLKNEAPMYALNYYFIIFLEKLKHCLCSPLSWWYKYIIIRLESQAVFEKILPNFVIFLSKIFVQFAYWQNSMAVI